MAWKHWSGLTVLLDLLCPPRCASCGTDLGVGADSGFAVCGSCAVALSSDVARCLGCGSPRSDDQGCGRCLTARRHWDGIAILTAYSDDAREAVLRAKRPGGEALAGALATLLVRKHRDAMQAWGIDLVVPVPMHWLRRATRGASSADEIARGVAAALGVPWRRSLRRRRATPMQNELPVDERWGNVRGAFRVRAAVKGRRILLVDDVTTTGATLADCRRALVEAGASAVYAGVIARAARDDAPAT
jgi:ComF family protein